TEISPLSLHDALPICAPFVHPEISALSAAHCAHKREFLVEKRSRRSNAHGARDIALSRRSSSTSRPRDETRSETRQAKSHRNRHGDLRTVIVRRRHRTPGAATAPVLRREH